VAGSDAPLSLALSPLLPPLRFAARAGVSRLNGLEPLVARVVASARAFASAESLQKLSLLEAAAQGFDGAAPDARKDALSALVQALGSLVPLPEDIAGLSGGAGKLVDVKPAQRQGTLITAERAQPATPLGGAPALETPVQSLRGVGPALADKLRQKGLQTVGDLLLELPRRYEDRRTPRTVAEAPIGERSFVKGRIVKAQEAHGRRRRFEVLVRDDAGGTLVCIWFHYRQSYLTRFPPFAHVMVSGEVREGYRGGGKVMHHPDVELLGEGGEVQVADDSFGRVVPVYSDVEGVPPRTFRRIQKRAVDEYARFVKDVLPAGVMARRKLLPIAEALREAHFPDRFAADLARGVPGGEPRRRLAFEELFLVQLGLALRRRGVKVEPGIAFRAEESTLRRVAGELPWPLTGAQERAVRAIAQDMRQPEPMNRLLQGDVGSGKTAVALVAARLAVEDGYQAALMAPTEILAEQHARSLRMLLRQSGVHVELVTGSLAQRERDHAARLLRSGTAQIVVGTHALAEEATAFHRLGLVIIDEQHRFGVLTRAKLMSKGHRPDVLVMTATPIPRTLALTLYGDLESSVLDELPPGRTPVATKTFKDSARDKAYDVIRRELAAGRQAYVVLPLVEESEKLTDLKAAVKERDRLAVEVFSDVPIGLVHGRQSAAERAEAMERFRAGDDRILVATTVIEVGVDVPNATVMLIEHAERFGLSQLHQLRGRVGRGAARSYCLLVTGTSGVEWGPIARERLKVMEKTSDGFLIAEKDLELRGPGEFLGTRQSGMPDFAVAELARDQNILQEAREEAFRLVSEDPELQRPENAAIRDQLLNRWRGRLSLARVG
jgi:ATP-dependent DNA helicase RecG